MRTFWHCIAHTLPSLWPDVTCDAGGTYEHTGGGDTGPAAKHTKSTGHPTATSVRPRQEQQQ